MTRDTTAVITISGIMYIPLYTTLYTQPKPSGLREATSCAPHAGKPSWVKNHYAQPAKRM